MVMEEIPIKGKCAQDNGDRQLDGILSPDGGNSHFGAVSGEKEGRGMCRSAVFKFELASESSAGLLGPLPEFLFQEVWSWSSFLVMLMLQVLAPHFENHW